MSSLTAWDVATGQPQIDQYPRVTSPRDMLHYLALNPDGQTLAALTSGDPRKLRFITAATGATIAELDWPRLGLTSAHFSNDGRCLGIHLGNGLLIYDVAGLRHSATLDFQQLDPTGPQSSVCVLSPDAKTVWRSFDETKFGGADPNGQLSQFTAVEIWDVQTRKKQQTLHVGAPVHKLAFLADGETVASLAEDGVDIRLWDRSTGVLKGLLIGHARPIQAFDYHAASNRLVSIAADDTFRFWELNNPVPWDPATSSPVVELAEAHPNQAPAIGKIPLENAFGMGRLNPKAPPKVAQSDLTPEQIAARQMLLNQFPEGTLLRGEWSFGKYDGRIVFRITQGANDQQQLSAEAYDSAKARDTKSYTGRFEFDEEVKAWYLVWTAIAESGLRRSPSRIPVTANLLLLGDQRVTRLRLLNGEWRGQDSTGAAYVLKLVKPEMP